KSNCPSPPPASFIWNEQNPEKRQSQTSSQDRHGRVSLFANGWLNNQQGRSKTKQEGTPRWPKSPRSIYALPLLDRPGDRASAACDRTEELETFLPEDSVCE